MAWGVLESYEEMMKRMGEERRKEEERRKDFLNKKKIQDGINKIVESQHKDILDIQGRQIKLSEQQMNFTKILALGTIILALVGFLNLLGWEFTWKVGDPFFISMKIVCTIATTILIFAIIYLLFEALAIIFSRILKKLLQVTGA